MGYRINSPAADYHMEDYQTNACQTITDRQADVAIAMLKIIQMLTIFETATLRQSVQKPCTVERLHCRCSEKNIINFI